MSLSPAINTDNNIQLTTILIPVYQPSLQLIEIIDKIHQLRPLQPIIVINDGSTSTNRETIFRKLASLNVTVLEHATNLGKGEALKTGFNYYLSQTNTAAPGVVTADADGQHAAQDIITLCKALEQDQHSLQLGVRKFSNKSIPWRSKAGNLLTRFVFSKITHTTLTDTQTGLRGIPRFFIQNLINSTLSGYEFELEMLIRANQLQLNINEIEIRTIYKNNNAASHFKPILDSMKIYYVFIKFSAISLISAILDFALFSICIILTNKIFISVIFARILSAVFNFSLNKNTVFKSKNKSLNSVIKYSLLAIILVFSSYALTSLTNRFNINIYACKLIAETILFITSFIVQRFFIFQHTN